MRVSRVLRTLAIAIYISFLLLMYVIQVYFRDEAKETTNDLNDDANDFGDGSIIYGYPRKEIAPISTTGDGEKAKIFLFSGEIGPQHLDACPEYNCEITKDRQFLNESRAIVFHNLAGEQPEYRNPDQFYVFFTQESPIHMSVRGGMRTNFFNLTLGFRRDADISCPYGYVVKRKKPLNSLSNNLMEVIKGKDRPVAWFVSNCFAPSRRSEYVDELKKYINVDIYGSCGTLSCPKGSDCKSLLEKRYKFYLAFENSLCKDYATEKFWERMTMDIVTVVLKRSIVANLAPPDSFIAADDFESPQALAEYLKKMDENEELYLKHFQWRLQYQAVYLDGVEHGLLERPWCFCRLCQRVQEKPVQRHSYENIDDWWWKDAACDDQLVGKLIGRS